jgi:hypothetical protein
VSETRDVEHGAYSVSRIEHIYTRSNSSRKFLKHVRLVKTVAHVDGVSGPTLSDVSSFSPSRSIATRYKGGFEVATHFFYTAKISSTRLAPLRSVSEQIGKAVHSDMSSVRVN